MTRKLRQWWTGPVHMAMIFHLPVWHGYTFFSRAVWLATVSHFSLTVVYTTVGLFTGQQAHKERGWAGCVQQALSFLSQESVAVGLSLLVWEESQEAWGEVSTFSAYLTFSCLIFRNSTRLDGSQRWGSTQIHGRSAYTNQEEFPILTLAEPLIIWQYIPCVICPGCRFVSVSQQSVFHCYADLWGFASAFVQNDSVLDDKAIHLKLFFALEI